VIFIDTNLFKYAAGKGSPQKKPCERLLRKVISSGKGNQYYTNAEVLQEILHRYRSIKLPKKAFELFDFIMKLGIVVLPVEVEDIVLARKFLEDHPKLSTRDGVHAAVVVRKGIELIFSYDTDFDFFPGLKRIEPT
jgi:predicted nucleic acid-binding protein